MKTDIIPEGQHLPVYLPDWGITAHWVLAPDGTPYLAVRKTCEELGVASASQLEKLGADDGYNDPAVLREFRIVTGGGVQATKCLRRAEAALWIATIKPGKVRPALREKIADVRRAIIAVADRLVFGDKTGVVAASDPTPRMEMTAYLYCLKCHAPHKLTWDGRDTHWEINES